MRSKKVLRVIPTYVFSEVSSGGVNGSSSHFWRLILVKVFNLRVTTRLANAQLYEALCFSHDKIRIVVKAVHI